MKVVDLVETEPTWDALDAGGCEHGAAATASSPGCDNVPDGAASTATAALNEAFNDEAPDAASMEHRAGEVGREAGATSARSATPRPGGTTCRPGALAPDGTLVGDDRGDGQRAGARARLPERDAGRARRTAGTALGLAIKVANHRQLREAWPECRVLLTGNADVNAPMNAVNDALGYREVERCVEMQKDI